MKIAKAKLDKFYLVLVANRETEKKYYPGWNSSALSKKKVNPHSNGNISEKDYRYFLELNKYDLELYRYATHRFDQLYEGIVGGKGNEG